MAKTKIFFATDIHGSETCFRKFLNAAQAYDANTIIMGGDITGKMIIPLIEISRGVFAFHWLDAPYQVSGDDLPQYEKQIRMSGSYPYRSTPDEKKHLDENPQELKAIFHRVMIDSARQWLEMAEERLKPLGVECFITPGNDDDLGLDAAFDGLEWVKNPEGKIVIVGNEYEMISSGYSNPTPWNSPRELEESALSSKIEDMVSGLHNPQKAIFNFHVPPYSISLDIAPRLDRTLKPVAGIGGVEMVPVGSTAVLDAIKKYSPLLSLHGHVHESRGAVRIGKTLCVNPGSEYSEGILRGCLLLMDKGTVMDYLLTSG